MTFDKLISEYKPRLRSIARRLDGKYPTFNQDDLMQEALVHLWQRFSSDQVEGNTAGYLMQGCYFAMKNFIRTNYKSVDRSSLSLHHIVDEDSGTCLEDMLAAEPESARDITDHRDWARSAGARLNERERQVCIMAADGLTTREIGSRLGVSHVMVVKIRKKINIKLHELRGRLPNVS